jgi:hypothetical protein
MHQKSKQQYKSHLIWLNIANLARFPDKTLVVLMA